MAPNFNPQEQQSLLGLLSALQSGLPGSQGYSLLQGVLGQQQSRLAARDERVGSLIDMITNAAASGQSYEAAQALAGAYSRGSNTPPRIDDALNSLYPATAGGTPGPGFNATAAAQSQQGTTSPIYQPQAPSPQDQLAQLELGQALQNQQATSMSSPTIAGAIADQAIMIMSTPDPATGVAPTLGQVISDPMIQGLDPVTQAMVLQEIQARLDQPQPQPGASQGGPGPVIPGTGGLTGGAGVMTRAQQGPGSFYQG
jgi:hypothetical protein